MHLQPKSFKKQNKKPNEEVLKNNNTQKPILLKNTKKENPLTYLLIKINLYTKLFYLH